MPAQVTVLVAGESQVRPIDAATTWADVLGEVLPGLPSRGRGPGRRGAGGPRPAGLRRRHRRAGAGHRPRRPARAAPLDCAHVMAQAVQDVFPDARLGIGPPIENGFYYEFDVPEPFDPEGLARIEKRMVEILKRGQRFVRRVVTEAEALAELADEPYKCRLRRQRGRRRA